MTHTSSCTVMSEKSVSGWHCISIKRYFYGIGYLVRGDVIFHMVGERKYPQGKPILWLLAIII